jgi:hypothetical protein
MEYKPRMPDFDAAFAIVDRYSLSRHDRAVIYDVLDDSQQIVCDALAPEPPMPSRQWLLALILLALALTFMVMGCGEKPTCPYPVDRTLECGIQLTLDRTRGDLPKWVDAPTLDRDICTLATYVEGLGSGSVAGVQVVLTGGPLPLSTPPYAANGRYHGPDLGWADTWVEVATSYVGHPSFEEPGTYIDFQPGGLADTTLAHELLHTLIQDHGHTRPEWDQLARGYSINWEAGTVTPVTLTTSR